MSENKEPRTIRFLYYAIPILLVTYVMSIGPIYVLYEDSTGQEALAFYNFYNSFYAPLLWCAERSELCNELILEYFKLCSSDY